MKFIIFAVLCVGVCMANPAKTVVAPTPVDLNKAIDSWIRGMEAFIGSYKYITPQISKYGINLDGPVFNVAKSYGSMTKSYNQIIANQQNKAQLTIAVKQSADALNGSAKTVRQVKACPPTVSNCGGETDKIHTMDQSFDENCKQLDLQAPVILNLGQVCVDPKNAYFTTIIRAKGVPTEINNRK